MRRRSADLPEQIGNYRILEKFPESGQAEVFRAEHLSLHMPAVVKLSRARTFSGENEANGFLMEGRLLAELVHPNLACAYDCGTHDGRLYLVIEYVRGQNLRQSVTQRTRSHLEIAVMLAKVCRALAVLHRRGITHQDIKPDNILVNDAGEPKVIDLGLARLAHAWCEHSVEPGSVSGTAQYMAPEQARGETERIGPASDVFGLGAVLYFCLVHRPPFTVQQGSNLATLLEPARNCHLDRSSLDAPQIPRKLKQICLRAMSVEPQDRYPTAAEMGDELERFIAACRRRLVLPLAVSACLAVLVVAVVSQFRGTAPPTLSESQPLTATPSVRVERNGKQYNDLPQSVPWMHGDNLEIQFNAPKHIQLLLFNFDNQEQVGS